MQADQHPTIRSFAKPQRDHHENQLQRLNNHRLCRDRSLQPVPRDDPAQPQSGEHDHDRDASADMLYGAEQIPCLLGRTAVAGQQGHFPLQRRAQSPVEQRQPRLQHPVKSHQTVRLDPDLANVVGHKRHPQDGRHKLPRQIHQHGSSYSHRITSLPRLPSDSTPG